MPTHLSYKYTYAYYGVCILTYMYMLALTHHPLQQALSISVGVLSHFALLTPPGTTINAYRVEIWKVADIHVHIQLHTV